MSSRYVTGHPRTITGQPRLLPILDYLPLLEAVDAIGKPERGIDMGSAIPMAAHGLVGLCALSSETLWHAMKALARYLPIRNNLFDYRCYQQGDAAVLELRPRLRLGGFEKFLGYASILALDNIFKAVSEEAMSGGARLTFPWGRPQASAQSATPCEFDRDCLGLRVPLEIAMRPSQSAEPDLCERLKMAGEEELTRSLGGTAAKVRHLLRRKTTEWPSLQAIAEDLGMSKRTLIRKLESEDLSFQLLLDEARSELACWFLHRPDTRISEIAEQVGFSDQAGFTRSFRRMQGLSPSRYRSDLRRALSAL